MFAFVGYCVQANGIHWPLQLTLSGVTYEQISQANPYSSTPTLTTTLTPTVTPQP